jgi:hypothetical protein
MSQLAADQFRIESHHGSWLVSSSAVPEQAQTFKFGCPKTRSAARP